MVRVSVPESGRSARVTPTAPHPIVTVVVPVLDAMKFLPTTVPSVLRAARHTGSVDLIYVDNGSTDGSVEYLRSLADEGVRVVHFDDSSLGGSRNAGARLARGDYLSFIDADCAIPESYFDEAMAVIRATGVSGTGCEVDIPPSPHWIERTWHALHYVGRDRGVRYLNSANFFVTRAAFERLGGFREDLLTGEDADIGARMTAAGLSLRESTRVQAIHLGNPHTIPEFYRRNVWHGLGMFATVSQQRIDKPMIMTALHVAATVLGIAALLLFAWPLWARGLTFVGLQFLAPALTVAHRMRQTRRAPRLAPSLFLYWLYYWARAHAAVLIATRRAAAYHK